MRATPALVPAEFPEKPRRFLINKQRDGATVTPQLMPQQRDGIILLPAGILSGRRKGHGAQVGFTAEVFAENVADFSTERETRHLIEMMPDTPAHGQPLRFRGLLPRFGVEVIVQLAVGWHQCIQ
jgi:hypothetical protein